MTKKEYLRREADEYMKSQDMTPQERRDLLEWLRSGESVYGNPWFLADDQGRLMDFLTAMRENADLCKQHTG